MPIVEDFLISLAAGFTQTLLQHAATRALGDPQRRALRSAYQAGFEHMLRIAGSGLSQAELGQVGMAVDQILGDPAVAQALLDIGLTGATPDAEQLEQRLRAASGPQLVQNIRFDFGWGMTAFQQGLTAALLAEAGRPESPLANRVIVNRLDALQSQVRQIVALVPPAQGPVLAPPPAIPTPSLLPSGPYYSCFISYSSRDQDFADRLHADLLDAGVVCWYAPENMIIGAKVRQAIDDAIRAADKLLIVLSANSVSSDWVEAEAEAAFEMESTAALRMFPIRLDNTVMETGTAWAAHIRRTRFIGDFRQWQDHTAYNRSLRRLLRDLAKPEDDADSPTLH